MYILTSRFNNETWNESQRIRNSNNLKCMYGSTTQICDKIPVDEIVYVIEMNNTTNKILGIGVINNKYKTRYSCLYYSNMNYNRYVYTGSKHLNREEISKNNEQIVKCLDLILFKGKTHMKRGSGITQISKKLMKKCQDESNIDIKKSILDLFKDKNDI